MGQIYRGESEGVPEVGKRIADGAEWGQAEVVGFDELTATCAMRRFRVVIRVVD